jgi:glycosyltransferase involved in cell wall biosynthesis
MANLLTQHGVEVDLFTRHSADIERGSVWQKLMTPVHFLYSWPARRDMARRLALQRPDVAHAHNVQPLISPSIFPVLRRAGVPVVMTVHNYRLLCPSQLLRHGTLCERCCRGNYWHGILHNCRGHRLESLVYGLVTSCHRRWRLFERYIDCFITPSEFVRQKLIQYGFPAERLVRIPHYVEGPQDLPPDGPGSYVLYFGRLSPEKGLFTLLEAMSRLPPIPLKIAGEGPLRGPLEQFATSRGLKQIEFLGYVRGDQYVRTLTEARLCVMPSECFENFPYAALESLVHAKPVIASNIGGLPEIVEDGVNGYLYPPRNASALADRIQVLWDAPDLAVAFGQRGREKVIQEFDKETHFQRLVNLYDFLLAPGIKPSGAR